MALGSAGVPAAAPAANADADARQRIIEEVPALLSPDGSIIGMMVTTRRPGQAPVSMRLSDPKVVALIAAALKRTIQQRHFQVGHQFHSPSETREIVFLHQDKPALRLLSVGSSMFWMSWGPASERRGPVNFQSEEFDDLSAAYFSPAVQGPPVAPDFSLRIVRRGCEGHCPEYSAAVDAHGAVTWHGLRYVRTMGDARRTISVAQVRSIVEKIRARRLMSLEKSMILCIDTPSVEVSLTLNGKSTSTVSDACAWRQEPTGRAMAEFIQYAESTMGIEHWIR